MPSVEADVSEDGAVESDSGGDNPQDDESVEDASTEDYVGDKDIVEYSFQVNTIFYVAVERLYCAACTCAERAISRRETQGLPKISIHTIRDHHTRPF